MSASLEFHPLAEIGCWGGDANPDRISNCNRSFAMSAVIPFPAARRLEMIERRRAEIEDPEFHADMERRIAQQKVLSTAVDRLRKRYADEDIVSSLRVVTRLLADHGCVAL
jgi:hypothetical protein